jgi:hypothetical protein
MNAKSCQSELQYARQLGLSVIPIQVGDCSSMRAFPLARDPYHDYRSRSSSAGLHLANAMRTASSRPFQLPPPLRPRCPLHHLPFAYLLRLRAQIEDPQMSLSARDEARTDLLNALAQEDSNVHADILSLIRALRRRGDITHRNAEELDRVLTRSRPAVAVVRNNLCPRAADPGSPPLRIPAVLAGAHLSRQVSAVARYPGGFGGADRGVAAGAKRSRQANLIPDR